MKRHSILLGRCVCMACGTSPGRPQGKIAPENSLWWRFSLSSYFPCLVSFWSKFALQEFYQLLQFSATWAARSMPWGMIFYLRLEVVGEAKNFRHAAGQPGCGVVALTFPGQVTLASDGFRFVDQAYKLQWVQEVGSGKGIWEGSCNFYRLQHICCEQRMSVSPSSYFFTFLAKVIF